MVIIILLILTFPCWFVGSRPCPPNQRDSLFEFSHSFLLHNWELRFPYTLSPSCDGPDSVASYPKTASWNLSVDCCGWNGVTCDESTGNVIGLNLRCSWLHGPLRSNSTLFRLPHLRSLDLSGNDFHGSTIPPEISVLVELTQLNLSWGNLSDHVPSELSRLNKLASLDLSHDDNYLLDRSLQVEGSSLERIAQNLSNLSFLDLSDIDMSNVIASSLMNLSSQMMYLSFGDCGLQGELPGNIFLFISLVVA
ncbi:hypothetical protein MLD38_036090 [Melastoma candidum]|uniref:Uncharacterized protein n=1 Tax=Melastoma candidum TaxID=119954 RepID=A0ACB9LIK5_9MYRT|nr:hypothetical protein MLD38_036090 [Melastoma candidum]